MEGFSQALSEFLVEHRPCWEQVLVEPAAASGLGVAELLMHLCHEAFPTQVRLMELRVEVRKADNAQPNCPYRSALLQVGNDFVSIGGIVDMPALNDRIVQSTRKLVKDQGFPDATIRLTLSPIAPSPSQQFEIAPRAWAVFMEHRSRLLAVAQAQSLQETTPPPRSRILLNRL